MRTKYKPRILRSITLLILFVLFLIAGVCGGDPAYTFAKESGYSNVLDDLHKDSAFDESQYPANDKDYSLQVIQIAESEDNELFVYVYQPCQDSYPLTATDINMSLSDKVGGIVVDEEVVAGSETSKLYTLTLLNTSGVFAKYKVNDFVVSSDIVRYYTLSAIYRDFINGVDTDIDNDNTVISKAFAVGKQYAAMTTADGVVYSCKDIDFIVIENPFVDFLAYGTYDGFDLIFGNVDYTDIHYIAFTPDRQIDTLKEADITYTTQDYTLNGSGPDSGYSYGQKSDPQFKTLTGKEEVGVDGHPEYTWNSIYTSSDFMTTTTLTDEAKEQVENSEFVLVFLATECSVQQMHDWMQGHYRMVEGTKVSDVTILRLMFETDGITYNLGVVMDKQQGDEIAGNRPEYDDIVSGVGMSFQTILMIIGLILLLIILWPILPYIVRFVVWVVCLPFKAVFYIVKTVKAENKKVNMKSDNVSVKVNDTPIVKKTAKKNINMFKFKEFKPKENSDKVDININVSAEEQKQSDIQKSLPAAKPKGNNKSK